MRRVHILAIDAWSRHRRFVRFLVAGGASVPVNLASRIALSHWTSYGAAILLAHLFGMLTAYTLTRLFVFERSGRAMHVELGRFAIVNVFSAALTWTISIGLVEHLFPAIRFDFYPGFVAHVAGLACASVTSFIGHGRFSFGTSR